MVTRPPVSESRPLHVVLAVYSTVLCTLLYCTVQVHPPPVSEGRPLHVVLAVAVDAQPAAPQRLGVGDVPRVVEQGGALILELETIIREGGSFNRR